MTRQGPRQGSGGKQTTKCKQRNTWREKNCEQRLGHCRASHVHRGEIHYNNRIEWNRIPFLSPYEYTEIRIAFAEYVCNRNNRILYNIL